MLRNFPAAADTKRGVDHGEPRYVAARVAVSAVTRIQATAETGTADVSGGPNGNRKEGEQTEHSGDVG